MANSGITKIWTQQITTPLTVNDDDNCVELSVLVTSGTCTINGNLTFKGLESAAMTLQEGQSAVIRAANQSAPLDGITITPSGTVQLMVSQ